MYTELPKALKTVTLMLYNTS